MKRPWLCILSGIVLGEVVSMFTHGSFGITIGCVCAIVIFVLVMDLRGKKLPKNIILLFLIPFALSMLRTDYEEYRLSRKPDPNDLVIESIDYSEKYLKLSCNTVLVYVKYDEESGTDSRTDMGFKIGNHISVAGDIRKTEHARNPGEFDFADYYKSKGIAYSCFADSVIITDNAINRFNQFIHELRLNMLKKLRDIYDEDDAAILSAALLGDKSQMSDELNEMYRQNGIAHLLAISGLHISILGMSFYKLLRTLGAGTIISGTVAGIWLIAYSIMTGSSVSTVRAVIMLLMLFLADSRKRTYDMLSSAALAAVAILLYQPYELLSCGFLLSFSAVASIGGPAAALTDKFFKKYEKIKSDSAAGRIISSVITSLCTQLGTLPVTAYFFFEIPSYAFILNLFVIPLMTYVVWSGLGALIFSFISEPLALVAGGSAHYILRFYRLLCDKFEKLPHRMLLVGRPTVVGAMLLSSILSFGRNVNITFMDVGQGDGIYIDAGEHILIDSGSSSDKKLGSNTTKPFLSARATRHIDRVFITHADNDHVSGIKDLLSDDGFTICELYLPLPAAENDKYDEIKELAEKKGTAVRYIKAGDEISLGKKGVISCISPQSGEKFEDINDESLILVYEYKNFSALFTGDASKAAEYELLPAFAERPENITVLKCGHHGSKSSTSEELLKVTKPKYAVLSYGENNRYGHPNEETIEALNKHGVNILRTAESGAVSIITNGKKMTVYRFM